MPCLRPHGFSAQGDSRRDETVMSTRLLQNDVLTPTRQIESTNLETFADTYGYNEITRYLTYLLVILSFLSWQLSQMSQYINMTNCSNGNRNLNDKFHETTSREKIQTRTLQNPRSSTAKIFRFTLNHPQGNKLPYPFSLSL